MSDAAEECLPVVRIKCLDCKKTKAEDKFRIRGGKRREVCLSCEAKGAREVQTRKLRKEHGDSVVPLEGNIKHCRACDGVYEINSFRGDTSKDGHFSKCVECETEKKPLMTKAELHQFRLDNGTIVEEKVEEISDKVTDAVNTGKDAVEDIVEAVEEAKGFWNGVRKWWRNLL